jgi:hypothetical protein
MTLVQARQTSPIPTYIAARSAQGLLAIVDEVIE